MQSRSDEVFLISGEGIKPLGARPFRTGLFGKNLEDALQTLIERQPNIINGRQIDPGSPDPPRFALLRREMQVGDWSLDHLLVDQHGVLTFVEAKLLENPEARRAVIGQVLDYAAYASEAWSDGRLKQWSADYWRTQGKDIDDVLRETFEGIDVDAFWINVETNLTQGKIRLIIAGDELRPEVRRVIEFLNEQLRTIQIFGLEIRCYGEEPNAVIVPFLVGQSQAASSHKQPSIDAKVWTIDQLQAAYANIEDSRERDRLLQLLQWAASRDCLVTGKTQLPMFGIKGREGDRIAAVYPNYVYTVLRKERYGSGEKRNHFVEELKKLGMYPADFDPATVLDGRNLSRTIAELDESEFSAFTEILSRYSWGAQASSKTS